MIADSFFEQGCTHEVCEDYALHGLEYAILSDGCSNGGGPRINSDWGSRLLCKAAEQHLSRWLASPADPAPFLAAVAGTAQTQVRTFPNLDVSCLTATLLLLTHHNYETMNALIVGDGIVGGKRHDGRWKIQIINFTSGAPYYLKYQMCEEEEVWKENCGNTCQVATFFGKILPDECEPPDDFTFNARTEFWQQNGSWAERTLDWDLRQPYMLFDFPKDEYEFAFVSSDGLESFYQPRREGLRKYNEPVHVLDVVRVLIDIRTAKQGFARLQRSWAFRQDRAGTFRRRNWLNGDDVSLGVICCE